MSQQKASLESIKESLDEEFFAKVVDKSLKLCNEKCKVISIDTKPATQTGDNYMSAMLRSTVKIQRNDGREETLSFIVKIKLPSNEIEAMATVADECAVFPKEQQMYSNFIPQFEKLYAGVGVEFSFGPEFYYTTDDPAPIIVLEDLSHYRMLDRRLGFDEDQTRMGLNWMAKFHAASMVFKEKNGPYEDVFLSGLFSMKVAPSFQSYLDDFIEPYTRALKHLPNCGLKAAHKIDKWRGAFYSSTCKVLEYDESAFNVLNHGDPWSNNFMFHYDEGQLTDIKLVDYQLPFWGSVAFDLYYFAISTWRIDFKIKKFDEMTKFYFDRLVENLKLLKYEKELWTYEDLQNELQRRKFIASAFTVELMPFLMTEKLPTDDDFFDDIYTNPRITRVLNEVIPWLNERNALDLPSE